MDVTAADIADWFHKYALLRFPDIKDYLVGDVFAMTFSEPWDIVITSHTVEHIPEADKFIKRLQEICSGKVYVYTPYNETNRISDHCITWSDERIAQTEPSSVDIITNIGWKSRGDCVLMTYNGFEKP